MPYENEHSARIRNPEDFADNPKWKDGGGGKFRRTSGGTLYGKIKIPSTVSIVWGKLPGATKKDDPPHPQSLRFSIKAWTTAKAKDWLKKNKIKYIRFESAKPKEKHSEKDTAPLKACVFNNSGEVFSDEKTEGKNSGFRMVVYNGDVLLKHWYWGNLGIDLQGLKFAKKPLPVLEEHFTSKRVGFTTKQKIDDIVAVEGKYLNNPTAQQLQDDIATGFPMEASMHVVPSIVERVLDGASATVNGRTIKGPGTIFRKAVIKEVSMCPMGAFGNTSSQALAANVGASEEIKFSILNLENIKMADEMTIETFADEHPDIYQDVFDKGKADGEKAERDLFAELETACANDLELLIQCYKEGKTKEEALQMRSEKLEKANTALQAKVTELETAKKEKENSVEPADVEFSDNAENTTTTDEPKSKEDVWKKEFAESEELQKEFRKEEFYLNYKAAEEKGLVRK